VNGAPKIDVLPPSLKELFKLFFLIITISEATPIRQSVRIISQMNPSSPDFFLHEARAFSLLNDVLAF